MKAITQTVQVQGASAVVVCPAGWELCILSVFGQLTGVSPLAEQAFVNFGFGGVVAALQCSSSTLTEATVDVGAFVGASTNVGLPANQDPVSGDFQFVGGFNANVPLPEIWWDRDLSVGLSGNDTGTCAALAVTYRLRAK